MITLVEYALMAGASYLSNRADINQFPVPSGWLATNFENPPDGSGFEAISFTKGNDIVISFAGTNFNQSADWTAANVPLAFGLLASQLKEAADYYLQIKAANPSATITLTGHSLGGGLAALIAVMFDENAVTFDQAPFNQSAEFFNSQPNPITGEVTTTSVALALRNYLTGGPYETMLAKLDAYIAANTNNPDPIAADTVAGRAAKVMDINVQGEILSSLPLLSRIGTQTNLLNSHVGASEVDLHSQALLAAFLQSGDTPTSTASDHTLGQVTFKLTDLLKMIFDKNLFAHDTDTTDENFIERLVRHEAGVGTTATSAAIAADAMVTRFTKDLWKLAQDGGLTMSDGNPTDATLNKVSKTLIAFAMQFYYEDTANAKDATKELFKNLSASGTGSNGVQFDIADVSAEIKAAVDANQTIDLTKAKGYQYFQTYFNNIANFTIEEIQLIQTLLPTLRDWYVQAGANGMSATDTNNHGAFMLGGAGADNLTGGTANDLLVGNAGDDQLTGGQGNDILLGGAGNDTLDGSAGNDNLRGGADYDLYKFGGTFGTDVVTDSDGQGEIEVDGQTLSGGTLKLESIYKDDITGYTTVKVNGGQSLVVLKEGNADRVIISNWSDTENLGINLSGEMPAVPTTGNVMNGDFKKKIDDHATADTNDDTFVIENNNYVNDGTEANALDLMNGTAGADVIDGKGGDDYLNGKAGNDHIEGGVGGDYIQGGLGKDTLNGGAGDDTIYGSSDMDIDMPTDVNFTKPVNEWTHPQSTGFNWTAGYDDGDVYSNGTPKGYTRPSPRNRLADDQGNLIDGGVGNDFIAAGTGADYVHGGADKDVIWGMDKDDILFGDAGNDVIYGDGNKLSDSPDSVVWTLPENHGNDIIDGGDGDDILLGQGKDDIIFGGIGIDKIWGDGDGKNSNSGDYTPYSIHGNDYIDSGDGNDQIIGGGKDDIIYGGIGNDNIWGDDSEANIPKEFHGNDMLYGGGGNDNLDGGAGNDTLDGGEDDDQLLGGDGNDTLITNGGNDALAGGAGNDTYFINSTGVVSVIDTEGQNKIRFGANIDPKNVKLRLGSLMLDFGNGNQIHIENFDQNDVFNSTSFSSFEFADGSVLTTNELLARGFDLDGTGADDTVVGTNITDRINGLMGNDTLQGGAGDDVLDGNEGDDNLQGGEGNDLLNGGVGDDIMVGSAGNDIYTLSLGDGFDSIEDTQGLNQIRFGAGITRTSVHASQYQGDDGNYYLLVQYGSGDDRVAIKDGLAGGIQSYHFEDGTQISHAELIGAEGVPFHVYGTQNADTLVGTASADILEGGVGDDDLMGLGGDDTILGGSGTDVLSGGDGNDLLDGGLGNDQLEGGAGQDSYIMRWGMGRDVAMDGADGELNTIKLDTGITIEDLTFQQQGTDLLLNFKGGNKDGLLIKNYYAETQQWQIENTGGYLTSLGDFLSAPQQTDQTWIESKTSDYESRVKALYYQTLSSYGFRAGSDGLWRKTDSTVGSDYARYSALTNEYAVITRETGDAEIYRTSSGFESNNVLVSRNVKSSPVFSGKLYGGTLSAGDGAVFIPYGQGDGGSSHGAPSYNSNIISTPKGVWLYPQSTSYPTWESGVSYTFFTTENYQVDSKLTLEKIVAGSSDNSIIIGGYMGPGYLTVDAGNGQDLIDARYKTYYFDVNTGRLNWEENYGTRFSPANGLQHLNDGNVSYEPYGINNIGALLYGNDGDDQIYGSAADDLIIGGSGNDTLNGESGADTYLVSAITNGWDTIIDAGHITREGYEVRETSYQSWYYESLGIADWRERYTRERYGESTGLPRLPFISPTDYAALEPLYQAGVIEKDTVEFGSGISLSDLSFAWGEIYDPQLDEVDSFENPLYWPDHNYSSGTGAKRVYPMKLVLEVSWGDNQGIRIGMPTAYENPFEEHPNGESWMLGAGIEQFKFADGTELSMKKILELAPPMPVVNVKFDEGMGGVTVNDAFLENIVFSASILPENIVISRDGIDLILTHKNGVDQLRIENWYSVVDGQPQVYTHFVDGTEWDSAELTQQGLVVTGGGGNDVLVGLSDFANTILGMGGDDQLTGGVVDDNLDGGDGNDMLFGHQGNDMLNGSSGDDALFGDANLAKVIIRARASLAADVGANMELWVDGVKIGVIEVRSTSYSDYSFDVALPVGRDAKLDVVFANDAVINGQDRNLFVESVKVDDYLMLPTDNGVSYDRGTAGGAFDGVNIISGQTTMAWNGALRFTVPTSVPGTGGDDWLDGGSGNDTMSGGVGNDTMSGGVGNDTYMVDSTGDVITELGNEGTDAVQSSITYTLGANLENLILIGSEAINGRGNLLDNLLTGNAANNTLSGNAGVDILQGDSGNDSLFGGTGSDLLNGGDGDDLLQADTSVSTITVRARASLAADVGANMELWIDGVKTSTIEVRSTSYADYSFDVELPAGRDVKLDVVFANDAVINGQDRNLFVESVKVDDYLMHPVDSGVSYDRGTAGGAFDGVSVISGQTTMAWNGALRFTVPANALGTSGNDLLIGGIGNDTITTGAGYDVIVFNKGDGQDIINASTEADNTISLGGNFTYSDLSLTKSTNDLVLKMGTTDQITLKDWYLGATNKGVVNLQVIAEAMTGFSLGSADTLRNNKIENFDFANLVTQFDAEGATTNWQFTDERLTAHLQAGSDAAAIGGDLAYQYGKNSNLTGMGLLNAQSVISAASFGQATQTLNDPTVWQAEVVKLG